MMPARNSSLCETTSASAGSSRSVGIKYCDQRIDEAFSLSSGASATRGFGVRRLDAAFVCVRSPCVSKGKLPSLPVGASDTQPKIQSAVKPAHSKFVELCCLTFADVTSALNHKV